MDYGRFWITGDKEDRAKPFSSAAFNKNVAIVRANWNSDFMDELESFPGGAHDDQVDSASGAFSRLNVAAVRGARTRGTVEFIKAEL